ncbi:cytochrome P450 [Nocardia thraciensis]
MRSEHGTEIPVVPGRMPGLGHLPALLRRPLDFVCESRAFAPVTRIYLGTLPAYLVNDPELVHTVLVSEADACVKGVHYRRLAGLLGESLATTTGVEHRHRRSSIQPAFRHAVVRRQAAMMREETERLIANWEHGAILAVDDLMRSLALQIVTRGLCTTEPTSDAAQVIRHELPLVLRGVGRRVLLSGKTFEWLFHATGRRFDIANQRLRDTVVRLVAHRRTSPELHDDLLAMLISTCESDTGAALSDNRIHDEMVNFLLAGTETTGNAMAWLWHAVAACPEVEQRLHIAASTGDLDYPMRVARETLRLYPPAWLVSRQASRPLQLGPWQLPTGAQILFSPYAIHRDPANFPAPDSFDPDRWLQERADSTSHRAWLAFGSGPQNCIGQGFALLEMATVAVTISREYRLVPVRPPRAKASATLVPDRLPVRIERRSHNREAAVQRRFAG